MKYSVGIIGYGKLGSTLSSAFSDMDNLKWIVDNDVAKLSLAKEFKSSINLFNSIEEIEVIPEYIFITVLDSEIENVAKLLAEKFQVSLKNKFIIHCSGAYSLDILSSCEKFGANTANLHPYQTFYYPSKELLKGCGWSIQAKWNHESLFKLVESLGGNPVVAEEDEKLRALYHCSAVIASNFMNTLLSLSAEVATLAKIDPKKFIPAIVNTTVKNNLNNLGNNEFPLTGPFARGDIETIKKHINALSDYPDLLKQYSLIALATLEKSYHNKMIDSDKYQQIKDILQS
jgi:predicted short-subunit dehydrogenase-like oxidoreductase (DUF2520 family)